jgi:hypothetical protein
VGGVNTFHEPTGRLAVGPVRRWVQGKPRLVAPSPDGTVTPVTKNEDLSYRVGVIFRAAVVLGTLAISMLLASWFILASTVLSTPNIGGTFWSVQRAAWVQGEAPNGSVVVAGSGDVTHDLLGRVGEFFGGIDGASIYQIAATPHQDIYTTPAGDLMVDGKKTGFALATPVAPRTLNAAYLGVCVQGPCGKPGTPVELPVAHVVGKVMGGLGLTGWHSAPTFSGSGVTGE